MTSALHIWIATRSTASVEKRDNPDLADKPVIIGGGRRGVVSTACYVARIRGVHSAMPMFKALQLCPDAVIVKPRMEAYVEASRAIRRLMEELTPSIEPLSLDEAFIDLSGTARLHGHPPTVMLARLVKRMRDELRLTGSIGLSHNKFLAKIASDLDKPRGFSVIGKAETQAFLRPKPVRLIWGVGTATQDALDRAGIRTFDDLLRWELDDLTHRFGSMGAPSLPSCTRTGPAPRLCAQSDEIHLERGHIPRGHKRSRPAGRPSLAHV